MPVSGNVFLHILTPYHCLVSPEQTRSAPRSLCNFSQWQASHMFMAYQLTCSLVTEIRKVCFIERVK